MAKGAVYLCAPFCAHNCRHGLPCEMWTRGHPKNDRGLLTHMAYELPGDVYHYWNGQAGVLDGTGQCTTKNARQVELEEEAAAEPGPITITIESGHEEA